MPRSPFARGYVFSHLPIHCRLQTILDCGRAALDEKITFQRRQPDYTFEGLHKFRIALRVDVRVGDLDFRRTKKVALHCRIIKVRMIESNRHRPEESVEIYERFVGDGVVQIWAATSVEIDNDLETIEQDVLLDFFENLRR